jgi:hypothetical protein
MHENNRPLSAALICFGSNGWHRSGYGRPVRAELGPENPERRHWGTRSRERQPTASIG